MRAVNLAMAALFAFAALAQLNDPDPVRWIAIYGAACAVSAWSARRSRPAGARGLDPAPGATWAPALVGVVAVVWAAGIVLGGPARAAYGHMFDTWEMKDAPVEEAREATGLLIVTVWMLILAVRERLRPA